MSAAKPTPNLGISKPKPDLSNLRKAMQENATPATHDDPQEPTGTTGRRRRKAKTQLIGAHLSPDVGKQLRMIAAEKDTDVKSLLIRALNLLFKEEGKPQIASDPLE